MKDFRSIPSIDRLLQREETRQMVLQHGHSLVVDVLRSCLDDIRSDRIEGLPSEEKILDLISRELIRITTPTLMKVINATGVILHTNLGRAPLSNETIAAIELAARGYSTLEYNIQKGIRGSRHVHCEEILVRLTGAEAAMVVNNNASAVLLILSALFNRKTVAISRSQLVEIGGSFRIPDVMRQSGAKLMEVGTTNQTHLSDYREALTEGAGGVARVHSSNFKIIGFSSEPDLAEIIETAHEFGALVMDDLGSGTLLDTAMFGLNHEPTVQDSVKAGADIISFSGDKLLGGPQAGIIIGRKELVEKLKKHPLARAIRADKMCLAGVSANLMHYLRDEAIQEIPIWKMISMDPDVIKLHALYWQEKLQAGEVIPGESTIGGGSLPGETLPTWLLSIKVGSPEKMLKALRNSTPAVIGRIVDDQVVLDPRTVFEVEEKDLLAKLSDAYRVQRM